MIAWLRRLFQQPPKPQYFMEGLGLLEFEDGGWCGLIPDRDRSLLICCGGDANGPDAGEMARLFDVWRHRDAYFDAALCFLESRETDAELEIGCSTRYGITIGGWGTADCVIELLGTDKETVWRVAFQGQTALDHAFDH